MLLDGAVMDGNQARALMPGGLVQPAKVRVGCSWAGGRLVSVLVTKCNGKFPGLP